MRRIAASMVLAALIGGSVLAASRAGGRSLVPDTFGLGEPAHPELLRLASHVPVQEGTGEIDVLFLTSDCRACRDLVNALAKANRQPPPVRAAVLVTDAIWPELSSLASPRITVVDDARAAPAVQLKATPTLATVEPGSGKLTGIVVGSADAFARFADTGRAQ